MYLRVGLDSFDFVGVIANKTGVVCLEPEPSAPYTSELYPYSDLLHNIVICNVPLSNRYLPREFVLNKVSKYRYLGCTLDEFMTKNIIGDVLADGASRALGKLLAKFYSNKGLGYKTYMSRVNVYLTFRMLLYFRNLIASLSNVKCGVMLWSDNGNIMDYWMFVARYCFKYGF